MIVTVPGAQLNLYLLGTFAMQRGGVSLPATRTRKEIWLLALLVLRHPLPVERGWLAGMLWPDSAEAQAMYNLRRSLGNLRDVLGQDAFRLTTAAPRALTLNLTDVSVDVLEFDAAIKRGDRDSLRRAAELYRGPVLQGCSEAWVEPERAMREYACLHALETLASEAAGRRQWREAAAYLHRALRLDPLRETALQSLLTALAAAGDTAGAVSAYRDFRLRLSRELRAEPSPETQQLYRQIKEHKGTDSVTTVFTLTPGYLPYSLTPLVGRKAEVEAITRELQNARLVTLTGAGGIGKTRVSMAVAAQSADTAVDGVWFVDLAVVQEAARVPQVVAQTLGIQEDPLRETRATLCHALRAKHLLLVLDNCEHVVPACAGLTHVLLRECEHIRILVTSRQPLGLAGERVWRIPVLSLPPLNAVSPPEGTALLHTSDAVRLFVERAISANVEFRLTDQNVHLVAQICLQLDGIAFAIELAAARVSALSLAQIVNRLHSPLSLIKHGETENTRYHTLRVMLDISYNLLNHSERFLLRRLSVFAGGWTLEAAEAFCGVSDCVDLLTQLVDKSLVVYTPQEEGARYHLLEMTREYAREHLTEEESAEAAARYARYFREQARLAREGMKEWRSVRQWIAWVRAERANCLAALAWWRSHDAEEALAFTLILYRIGVLSYHSPEARAWTAALCAEANPPATPLYAAIYREMGEYAGWLGEKAVLRGMLHKAFAIAGVCGDLRALADTEELLGLADIHYHNFESAQVRLERALAYYEQAGDSLRSAMIREEMTDLALERGDIAAACDLVKRSQQQGRKTQDERILARVEWQFALVARAQEDYTQALLHLEQFVTRVRQAEAWPLAKSLTKAGEVAHSLGAQAAAQQYLEAALVVSGDEGERPWAGWALSAMGLVALAQQDLPRAEEAMCRSLRVFREIDEIGSICVCMEYMTKIYAAQGRGEAGVTLLAQIEMQMQTHPLLCATNISSSIRVCLDDWKAKLPPDRFETAWQRGVNMMLDQAIAFVLDSMD